MRKLTFFLLHTQYYSRNEDMPSRNDFNLNIPESQGASATFSVLRLSTQERNSRNLVNTDVHVI